MAEARPGPDGRFSPRACAGSTRTNVLATATLVEAYGMTGSVLWRGPHRRTRRARGGPRSLLAVGVPASDDALDVFAWGFVAFQSARLIGEADVATGSRPLCASTAPSCPTRGTGSRRSARTEPPRLRRPSRCARGTRIFGRGPSDAAALARDLARLSAHPSPPGDPEADLPVRAVVFAGWASRFAGLDEARSPWVARADRWLESALVTAPGERRGTYADGTSLRVDGVRGSHVARLPRGLLRHKCCFLKSLPGTDPERDAR